MHDDDPAWGITPEQAQHAHNLLNAITAGRVPVSASLSELYAIALARDVLCWALGHSDNPHFPDVIRQLDEHFKAAGIEFRPIPHPPPDPTKN